MCFYNSDLIFNIIYLFFFIMKLFRQGQNYILQEYLMFDISKIQKCMQILSVCTNKKTNSKSLLPFYRRKCSF